jgi:hypothetical protein
VSSEPELCLRNNLAWYGSVLAPHGLAGSVSDGLWTCDRPVPPYYSNAITLAPGGIDAQYRGIEALSRALAEPYSIKDSFAKLDLVAFGFRKLFDADWIWRDAAPKPAHRDGGDWRPVADAASLEAWEVAWCENGSPTDTRVFLPALLDDPSIRLFARHAGGRVVAGCAANLSDDVVGLSNVFSADLAPGAAFAESLTAVAAWAPERPIVGYESGESLAAAGAIGFRFIGRLAIWLRESV